MVKVKTLKNNSFLIETRNSAPAEKMKVVKCIGIVSVVVERSHHKTLNSSKGIINCEHLCFLEDNTILEELKEDLRRILKRGTPAVGEQGTTAGFQNTGSFCLTFNTPTKSLSDMSCIVEVIISQFKFRFSHKL